MFFSTNPKTDTGPTTHAPYSPSTYPYRELCPNWEDMTQKDMTAADRGTLLHEAFETEDFSKIEGEWAETDSAVVQQALGYVEFVKKKRHRLAERINKHQWHMFKVNCPGGIEYKEVQVTILDQWGTVDRLLILVGLGRADIMDFKSGWNSVDPAERNKQMWAYLLGVWDMFPEIEKVTVHILSPRRDEINTHTFRKRHDYMRVLVEVRRIIEESKEKQYYNPGPKQCMYCGAKYRCPALLKMAATIAERYQGKPLLLPQNVHSSELQEPSIMNTQVWAAKIMEDWSKSVLHHIRKQMREEGTELEDFRIAEEAGNRSITSAIGAWDVVKSRITLDEFLSCCTVGYGELVNIIREKAPRGKKGREEELLECKLKDRLALSIAPVTYKLKKKSK